MVPTTTKNDTIRLVRMYVDSCAISQASTNVCGWNSSGRLKPVTGASRGFSASSSTPRSGKSAMTAKKVRNAYAKTRSRRLTMLRPPWTRRGR